MVPSSRSADLILEVGDLLGPRGPVLALAIYIVSCCCIGYRIGRSGIPDLQVMSPRNEVVDRLGGFKHNLNNGLLVDISRSFHEKVLATVCTAWIYRHAGFGKLEIFRWDLRIEKLPSAQVNACTRSRCSKMFHLSK
jgi:hypothetical protein